MLLAWFANRLLSFPLSFSPPLHTVPYRTFLFFPPLIDCFLSLPAFSFLSSPPCAAGST